MDYKDFSAKIKAKYPGTYDDMDDQDLAKRMVAKYPQYSDVSFDSAPDTQPQSMGQKAWSALAWPEKKSREGLQMLAGMVPKPEPSGKPGIFEAAVRSQFPMLTSFVQPGVIQDLGEGAPRIAADTMAEAAPGFISRGALLTSGAAEALPAIAPVAKSVLRSIGAQGEEMSGIAPKAAGALEAAYKDPTLIFSKGKKAAGEFYEAAKDELNAGKDTFRATSVSPDGVANMEKTKDVFSKMYKPQEILDKANEFVDGGGQLEPAEGLKVRKAIDILLKSKQSVPDELYKMRDFYDGIAKESENLSAGDATYQRGIKADALKNFFPQNKYGGASAFKSMILKLTGGMAAPLLSPAVQGGLATGAGLGAQAIRPFVGVGQNAGSVYAITQALNDALAKRRQQNAQ